MRIESLLQNWGLRWPQTMKEVKDNQLRDLRSKIRTCYGESATPSGQKRHPQTWPWWCFPSITHLWLSWWVAMRLQWQNASVVPEPPAEDKTGTTWLNCSIFTSPGTQGYSAGSHHFASLWFHSIPFDCAGCALVPTCSENGVVYT